RALPQDQCGREGDQHVERALERRRKALAFDILLEALFALSGKGPGKRFLEREGLDSSDGADGFREGGGHGAFLAALFLGNFTNAAAHADGPQPKQWQNG